MTTLSPDEVALIRSILTALRTIKVRDIDKALAILSKSDPKRISEAGREALPERYRSPQEDTHADFE